MQSFPYERADLDERRPALLQPPPPQRRDADVQAFGDFLFVEIIVPKISTRGWLRSQPCSILIARAERNPAWKGAR